jgi:hypothetical protein
MSWYRGISLRNAKQKVGLEKVHGDEQRSAHEQ